MTPSTECLFQHLESVYCFVEQDMQLRKHGPDKHHAPKNDFSLDVDEEIEAEQMRVKGTRKIKNDKDNEGFKQAFTATLEKALDAFSDYPELGDYNFSSVDICLVAQFYHNTKENFDLDLRANKLYFYDNRLQNDLKGKIDYLIGLMDREIISTKFHGDTDYHYSLGGILDGSYTLNTYLLNLLLGREYYSKACEYLHNKLSKSEQPMIVVTNYLSYLFNAYPELVEGITEIEQVCFGQRVLQYLDFLWEETAALPRKHQLRALISRHKLSHSDFSAIMLIFHLQDRLGIDATFVLISNLLSRNVEEYEAVRKLICPGGTLRSRKLLEENMMFQLFGTVTLSESLLAELRVDNNQVESHGKLFALLKGNEFLSEIKTTQTLSQLILPQDTLDILTGIITRLKDPARFDLSQWGLTMPSIGDEKKALNGCNLLLHGYPGTGKTFIAGVIANELQRPLIQIQANNIRNCYYGASEKNARKLFSDMREIVKTCKQAPIFLLNEGDQLIHKRSVDSKGGCSDTENAIQSVFLEELESFPGVVIVTTNLVTNLDQAMSRRFHIKLELGKPDADCRKKLWRIHLPESIPGAAQINVAFLAEHYDFTGGQIRVVVQNACSHAMLRGSGCRIVITDICRFADMEAMGSFEEVGDEQPIRNPIGFRI